MPLIHLDSPQNSTIKSVARLRTRRGRQQQGCIIVDGRREVQRAVDAGIHLKAIFVHEGQADEWSNVTANVYSVSERAFAKIAFGDRHEVIAVCETPNRSLDGLSITPAATIGVLECIEKPGNIGAVIRSADGAGLDAIILVEPVTDLFNPNAIRSSLGTIFSMPTATAHFEQYRAWAERNSLRHLLAACDDQAENYLDADFRPPCAIVLGSEAQGLTPRWNALSGNRITIPMQGRADSLNVASTASVLFFKSQEERMRR